MGNVVQLKSLLGCIEGMVAGKDLLAGAVYEMLGRRVPVAALDNRAVCEKDSFYDPLDVEEGEAPYLRVVANVQDKDWSKAVDLQRPVLVVMKHLCGGATDASLVRTCEDLQLEGLCIAPCCHQKLAYE